MSNDVKIGITAKFHKQAPVFYGVTQRHIQFVETAFANWVAKNKGLPLVIPSDSENYNSQLQKVDPAQYAEELDALVLQGGVDVHPSFYSQVENGLNEAEYDRARDTYELALIKAFLAVKKPILGICRGLQLINVYFGGSLHTDLQKAGFQAHLNTQLEEKFIHQIRFEKNGWLDSIYSKPSQVVSIHHQGIDRLGQGLKIEAYSEPDSVIESVRYQEDGQWVLAVQWHPEFHQETDQDVLEGALLFKNFLEVARHRKFFGTNQIKKVKKLNFSQSDPLTLGAELELQLIDPISFDLAPKAGLIIDSVKSKTNKIKSEIFRSMIEIETGICTSVQEIEKDLSQTSQLLLQEAYQFNIFVGASGTHPFAHYLDRILTNDERYKEIVQLRQWIARRIAIFGLHCHVGARNQDEAIQLYRFYLSMAPILLGLSASSPFYHSDSTGLSSVRSTFFESMPSGGHPPILKSWSEFDGLIAKMMRSKSIRSHKDLWWDVRPSPGYGTIEIRICDVMPSLKQNSALIAFIHLLGSAHLNEFGLDLQWPILSDWTYRENKWRALRHGLNFSFILNENGDSLPARDYILSLIEALQPLTQSYGYEGYVEELKKIVVGPGPAEIMTSIYAESRDLKKVVSYYVDEFKAVF